MAAHHLPQYLVRTSSGLKELAQTKAKKRMHTSGDGRWQLRDADVEEKGDRADPCETPFLRCHSLLRLPLPVEKVKLRLPTIAMIMRTMFLLLPSEIPSGMCAKLRTVAASNNRVHARNLLLLLARATYTMVLFFTHIPFVVKHIINATPPERLQHYQAAIAPACR